MSEYTPAEREADRRFIESRLAPENEQRADDFITGADWQYAENIRKLKRHTDDQLAALLVQALIEGNYLAEHDREVAAKAWGEGFEEPRECCGLCPNNSCPWDNGQDGPTNPYGQKGDGA